MTIINNVCTDKYNRLLVGISKDGDWWLYEDDVELILNGKWLQTDKKRRATIIPSGTIHGLTVFDAKNYEVIPIDLVFPILHGKYGEDGTVQGLLELAGIPYVGCRLLSSALCMDKYYTKIIVEKLGIKQAEYEVLYKNRVNETDSVIASAIKRFGYPVFVKPCNSGSSVGVSKANNYNELRKAIEEAFLYDRKVLLERAITGRELECSVLDADRTYVSGAGEVTANSVFYSYEAKYNSLNSRTDVEPDLPENCTEKIKENALKIFKALDCSQLSRIDFFLEDNTNEIIFNEINTMPGFTNISMYPALIETLGITLPQIIEKLICHAS